MPSHPSFKKPWQQILVLVIAGLVSARLLWLLCARAIYEFQGGFEGDGHIYMAVGRGILNGLLPYQDMFETKPPGMFVISALSLQWFDSIVLGNIVQAVITLGLAAATIAGVWMLVRPHWKNRDDQLIIFTSIGVGALIGFFASVRSGGFQTESFGSFFVALYLLVLVAGRGKRGWLLPFLGGILLMLAAGLKEPFVVAGIAGALLLLRTWKDWLRLVFIPCVLAGIMGSCLLFILGWWQVYTALYLPYIFGSRLAIFGPAWVRALMIDKTWTDLVQFSWPLGIVVGLLFLSSWWMMARAIGSGRSFSAYIFSTVIATATFFMARYEAMNILGTGGNPHSALSAVLMIMVFGAIVLGAMNLWILGKKSGLEAVDSAFRHLFFLYLLLQVNGLGGDFVGHQFGFAVPFYIALFLHVISCMQASANQKQTQIVWLMMAGSLLLITLCIPVRHDRERLQEFLAADTEMRAEAASFDAMLDACHFSRYLIVGEVPVDLWAYTHHSALGPGFFQYAMNYPLSWVEPDPYFINSHIKNLQTTPVIVVPEKGGRPVPDEVIGYIQSTFTPVHPACAGEFTDPISTRVLFRK